MYGVFGGGVYGDVYSGGVVGGGCGCDEDVDVMLGALVGQARDGALRLHVVPLCKQRIAVLRLDRVDSMNHLG